MSDMPPSGPPGAPDAGATRPGAGSPPAADPPSASGSGPGDREGAPSERAPGQGGRSRNRRRRAGAGSGGGAQSGPPVPPAGAPPAAGPRTPGAGGGQNQRRAGQGRQGQGGQGKGGQGKGGQGRGQGRQGSGTGGGQGRPRQGQGSQAQGGQGQRARGGAAQGRAAQASRPAGRHEPTRPAAPAAIATAAAQRDRAHDERTARIASNRRRVLALCVGFAALPALVLGLILGLAVGPLPGAVAGACLLVLGAAFVARRGAHMALSTIGARPLAEREDPALANLVDGLCATVGVGRPELWLVDDPVLNACTLSGPGCCALVVTSGLRRSLGLIEMEGVVAHELAHLQSHDATVSAVAVATAGRVGRFVHNDRLLHRAVGAGREYRADRDAVLAVRYPPGLRNAFGAMRTGPGPAPGSVFTGGSWLATRWVWIDPMVGADDRSPIGELDATDVRMDALAEW